MNTHQTTAPGTRGITLTREPEVSSWQLKDDGQIPNNPQLELLYYKKAATLASANLLAAIKALVAANDWGGVWQNGVFTFHHYHSTAHEMLFVNAGWARLQLGGEKGIIQRVEVGDVVIIPAGVGHKNLEQSGDFSIIGAYPRGQQWNLCLGKKSERPTADKQIAQVPLPLKDPFYGTGGPLLKYWRNK